MALGFKAFHGRHLLLIGLRDIDKTARCELTKLRLVGFETIQAHLLGRLRTLDSHTVGIALDTAFKHKLAHRVVVRV